MNPTLSAQPHDLSQAMQAQSRHAASSGSGSAAAPAPADEHDAVVRELVRGSELTARLQAEALRALRGRGQSEKTAAFILQEVSRAFAVCLSIMNAPGRSPPPPPPPPQMPEPGVPPAPGARRNRDDSVPRTETVTYRPHADGYLWRKYGKKRITNTYFPRCYYRCSYRRERGCPAMKQVQQRSHGDPPEYVVVYLNEHTCNNTPASSEPEAAAPPPPDYALDLPGLMLRWHQHGVPGALDERDAKLEQERRALVSSLACVLGGGGSPPGGAGAGGAVVQEAMHGGRTGDASASTSTALAASPVVGASDELPGLDVDGGLDVMDYDVTGDFCFGDTYGLHDDGSPF